MNTRTINQSDPGAAEAALQVIRSGGVVAVPTDTVYGIACAVDNPAAIKQLYRIKERDALKAIPVLVGALDQLEGLADDFNPAARSLAERYWPGALTIIVNKNPALPVELTTYPTVGLRMPHHDWLLVLMRSCGPLAATSANLSGAASPVTADEVLAQLDGRVELVIDGERCEGGIPSTVVDCSQTPVKVLREGGIASADIIKAISLH
jgi:L-threonylcarbamoyladenylate synthase